MIKIFLFVQNLRRLYPTPFVLPGGGGGMGKNSYGYTPYSYLHTSSSRF